MNFIKMEKNGGIAELTLERGKVNALNPIVIEEMKTAFESLEDDRAVKAVVLTGRGKFFSFGFDIPELRAYSKDRFTEYLISFSDLCSYMFLYPKPVVAALNGHAVAGGCMLALACDYIVMAAGKAKISLNEIDFGSSVFAGTVEMLRFWAGSANATRILCSGAMFAAQEAIDLGLVHEMADEKDLLPGARKKAMDLGGKPQPAFASIKALLRKPAAEAMIARERASIEEFVDIWYSEATWENIRKIDIR